MIDKFTKKFIEKKVEEKVKKKVEEEIDIDSRASYDTVSSSNDLNVIADGQISVVAEAYATSNSLEFIEMTPSIAGNTGTLLYKFKSISSVTNTMNVSVSDPTISAIDPVISA